MALAKSERTKKRTIRVARARKKKTTKRNSSKLANLEMFKDKKQQI